MSYTTGSRHDLVTETSASSHFGYEGEDFSADVADNTDPYIPADAMQFPTGELDLDHLLNLGGLVTSQDPLVSSIATRDAVSTISRFNQLLSPTASTHSPVLSSESENQTIFSNVARALPPSSRTTLISKAARISKPGSRARTPAASSHSTSITSSRPSKRLRAATAASAPGHTAAIMSMSGAISHAADCFQAGIQLLTTPSATSTQTPPATSTQTQSHEASFQPPPPPASSQPPLLPASSQTPPYRLHAAKLITEDAYLDRTIGTKLFLEFARNDAFCQMWASVQNPVRRREIALQWHRENYPSDITTMTSPTPAPVLGSLVLEAPPAPPSTTSGAPSNAALASTSDGGYLVGQDGSDVDPYASYNDNPTMFF